MRKRRRRGVGAWGVGPLPAFFGSLSLLDCVNACVEGPLLTVSCPEGVICLGWVLLSAEPHCMCAACGLRVWGGEGVKGAACGPRVWGGEGVKWLSAELLDRTKRLIPTVWTLLTDDVITVISSVFLSELSRGRAAACVLQHFSGRGVCAVSVLPQGPVTTCCLDKQAYNEVTQSAGHAYLTWAFDS
ncbi:hypothetical protein JZ751_003520 [Albula glossodonta]|uniref:Secreted protein n=1 Tax=Albula glossodonta TaxID=121402 RepID=A0A8T2N6E0_9TELE|nr:hypothetical protein JZ751_003520 [Albula glossodonta]